jgi:hypothetical protein
MANCHGYMLWKVYGQRIANDAFKIATGWWRSIWTTTAQQGEKVALLVSPGMA